MISYYQIKNTVTAALGELYDACALAAEWLEEGEIQPKPSRRGPVGRQRAAGLPGSRAPHYSRHRRAGRSLGSAG